METDLPSLMTTARKKGKPDELSLSFLIDFIII
jgi:hypothetical protein